MVVDLEMKTKVQSQESNLTKSSPTSSSLSNNLYRKQIVGRKGKQTMKKVKPKVFGNSDDLGATEEAKPLKTKIKKVYPCVNRVALK